MDELKRGSEVSVQFYGKIEKTYPNGVVAVVYRANGKEFSIYIPEEFIEDVG